MATKSWAILLIILMTFLTAFAQFLWKLGSGSGLFNYYILAGFAVYGVAAILMIASFKGGELSVLYPIIATSYVWVTLISLFLLHEPITVAKWAGVALIVLGVSFVGFGSA